MKMTTLCYISRRDENDEEWILLLYRNRKANDQNEGKWIGVGGKFQTNESPDECMIREVLEETGLGILHYQYRGIVTFVSNQYETEYMHIFTADEFEGTLQDCKEGTLHWVRKSEVLSKPTWEGDRVFLTKLLGHHDFFSIKLTYDGEKLIEIEDYNY